MRIAWLLISTLSLLALFAQNVNADARQTALGYLEKYKIPYPKGISSSLSVSDDDKLLETVKYYRDSVAMNMDLFGAKVERLLNGLRIKLEAQHEINKNNVEALLSMLQHALRKLELRGELTREKVFAELDKIKHKAIERHLANEAQWKQVVNDISMSFASDAWYRRFLGGRYHRHSDEGDDGFHRWKKHLERRLKRHAKLTGEQIDSSLDTVQRAIHSTPNINKLGDTRWWHRIERELKNKLQPDQVKDVVDSVRDDVQAYKIFALDYAPEEAKHWFLEWRDWIKDTWIEFTQWLWNQYNDENSPTAAQASASYAVEAARSRSVDLAAASASSAAHSITQAAQESVSSIKTHVQDTTDHWKQSFGNFWLEKEKQAYKRIGYTEAQLQWVHDHLEKTIHDRTSLAKHNIDTALYTVRRYLQETRVQSASQIEHQITRIQNLLEVWKKSLPTERTVIASEYRYY
ncbi:hypothetical protein BJV82DRAFT_664692 [Fennellomyces sp. T-0311]|nr:hypothetical protein BJV82DRAFT_664692 [Fennellomyces sp. T-0311]